MPDSEAPYLLHTAEGREFGALYSIKSDLIDTLSYCKDLQASARPFTRRFVDEPLREAAVVKYARCFTTGVRPRLLDDLIARAPSDFKSIHERILAIRSKLVAHSVNELEETNVIAFVALQEDEEQVLKVGVLHAQRTPLLAEDLAAFVRLLEWLLPEVERFEQHLRERALASAKAMPLAELKKNPLRGHGERAFRAGSPFKSRPKK